MSKRDDYIAEQLGEVRSMFEYSQDALNRRMDPILESMAFYRGFQYRVVNGNFVGEDDDTTGEAHEVKNIILPIVRASVSNKMKQQPNPEVAPMHGDQKSRAKAKNVSIMAKSFAKNGIIDMDEMYRCLLWAQITGAGWIKTYWDVFGGMPEMQPGEGKDEFGGPKIELIYPGEIATTFVPTVDCLPDPAATTPKELRYIFHQKLIPTSELEKRFPEDVFGKKTDGRWESNAYSNAQQEYRELMDLAEDLVGKAHHEADSLARMVEFWELPSKDHPRGRFVIFSGQMCLHAGPNPLWPIRLPFTLFYGDNLIPGALYAEGVVEQLKSVQRSLNRAESKQREMVDRVLNPYLMAPFESGVSPDSFGDIPGQVVQYRSGHLPSWSQPPNIPTSLFEYGMTQMSSAKEISGYSDISHGDVPTGVESGRAIAFLRENEQSVREPDMMLFRKSYLNLLQQAVWYAQQFYEEGRMVKVIGEDYKYSLMAFKEDDFDWNTELVTEVYSGAPSSHALRFAETLEMYQNGLFDPMNPGAKAVRQILGSDYAGRASYDPFQEDKEKAERENTMFLTDPYYGEPPMPFDEHEVHVQEHNRVRKTSDYDNMMPEQKAAFDAHCNMHEMMLQAQVMGGVPPPQGGAGGAAPPGMAPPPMSPDDGGHDVYPGDQGQSMDQMGGGAGPPISDDESQ